MAKADCEVWVADPQDPTHIVRYAPGEELPDGALPAGHRSLIDTKPAKKKSSTKKK